MVGRRKRPTIAKIVPGSPQRYQGFNPLFRQSAFQTVVQAKLEHPFPAKAERDIVPRIIQFYEAALFLEGTESSPAPRSILKAMNILFFAHLNSACNQGILHRLIPLRQLRNNVDGSQNIIPMKQFCEPDHLVSQIGSDKIASTPKRAQFLFDRCSTLSVVTKLSTLPER